MASFLQNICFAMFTIYKKVLHFQFCSIIICEITKKKTLYFIFIKKFKRKVSDYMIWLPQDTLWTHVSTLCIYIQQMIVANLPEIFCTYTPLDGRQRIHCSVLGSKICSWKDTYEFCLLKTHCKNVVCICDLKHKKTSVKRIFAV